MVTFSSVAWSFVEFLHATKTYGLGTEILEDEVWYGKDDGDWK